MTNDLVPVKSLKKACVILAKVHGYDNSSLKFLCSRGKVHESVNTVEWKEQRQWLEESYAYWCVLHDYPGRKIGIMTAADLLEKAGVRHVETKDVFVKLNVIDYDVLNKDGSVIRTLLGGPGVRVSKKTLRDGFGVRKREVHRVFAVRMLFIPEAAVQVLRWKKGEFWADVARDFEDLACMIEYLSSKKNVDGASMDELVSEDLKKLRKALKEGSLEGDGWKVEPNTYDWLLARRGRRDADEGEKDAKGQEEQGLGDGGADDSVEAGEDGELGAGEVLGRVERPQGRDEGPK